MAIALQASFLKKMKMNTRGTKRLGNEGKPKTKLETQSSPKNCKILCLPRKADILRKIEEIVGHMEKKGGGAGAMTDGIAMSLSVSFQSYHDVS